MKNKGFFISLEGGEGCGKSTQLKRVADALSKSYPGRKIIATRSPGGTPVAERIRTILKEKTEGEDVAPETELLLFGACHAQMVRALILPALERGDVIITDRFFDSTIVYQGYARGLGRDAVQEVNRFACGDLKPDLTIVLDLPPEAGVARTHARAVVETDRFDSETDTFHRTIRAGFLELAKEEPERFAVINAAQSIEEVTKDILEVIHGRLA